ncbi:MAG: hypothetical protein SWX82_04510 [Cyanobacteriota bacterium]|nr:hypothetical protein [Cyanobacteriota bacterium]
MKKHKITLTLAFISCGILILLSLLNTPQSLATQQARISQIIDGDTLEVTMSQCRIPWSGNSQLCRLQLACIDGPDYGDSPFFEAAKSRLETLIPRGTIVLYHVRIITYNKIFVCSWALALTILTIGAKA